MAWVLLVGGCHASQNTAASSEYARQVTSAQLRTAQLEEMLLDSQRRLIQLEDVIQAQGRSEATQLENLDQVNDEVTRLRGAIEVLQFETSELKRLVNDSVLGQEQRQVHDENRLKLLEKALGMREPPLPRITADDTEPTTTPPEEPAPLVEVPDTATAKLELAASHMEADRQAVARAVLNAAVQAHEGDREMAEIRYRLAETYYNEGAWKKAISEFNKVINNHAGSPWACWSYYRQGESFDEMGQQAGAKAFYRGAIEGACKSSDAAKEARKKL